MLHQRLVVNAPPVANLLRRVWAMSPAAQAKATEANRVLLGSMMSRLRPQKPRSLAETEFKVFSQFGEDGIIDYLVSNAADVPHTFIEFGVENYRESNTRFLLWHANWRGLVIDGSPELVREIRAMDEYWRFDLTAAASFITRDNINELFLQHGYAGEIGLLSIDIDGNDYWVWEAIDAVDPVVVVVEFNSTFGPDACVSVPYAPDFRRTVAHSSNLYFGASLSALRELGERNGYAFVGCNSNGNNAFFVRAVDSATLSRAAPGEGYVESRFRESRDADGNLTYVTGEARLGIIKHLPVVDLAAGITRSLGEAIEGSTDRA